MTNNKYLYVIMFWVIGIPIHMKLLPMMTPFSEMTDETRFLLYITLCMGYTWGFIRGRSWDKEESCDKCGRSKKGMF